MDTRLLCGPGNVARNAVRRRAQNSKLAAHRFRKCRRVGDIELARLQQRACRQALELLDRAIDHGHLVATGSGQQVHDHFADLAGAGQ
jgi:hypothetical protein